MNILISKTMEFMPTKENWFKIIMQKKEYLKEKSDLISIVKIYLSEEFQLILTKMIYLVESNDLLEYIRNNIRFSNKSRFSDLEKKFTNLRNFYEEFLKSDKYKKMINIIKTKHDEEYLKIFFRHSKNFLNLYIKDTSYCKIGRRLSTKSTSVKSSD